MFKDKAFILALFIFISLLLLSRKLTIVSLLSSLFFICAFISVILFFKEEFPLINSNSLSFKLLNSSSNLLIFKLSSLFSFSKFKISCSISFCSTLFIESSFSNISFSLCISFILLLSPYS